MAGRPPAGYDPDVHPILAEQYAREGLTNKEIAARFERCESTFYKWCREHPEFRKALKEGKELTDAKVERAVLDSALSGSFPAQRLWLINRRPDRWRDTQRMEVTGADGGALEVHGMSDEEIERRSREILAKRSGNPN